ncbi:urease accessory protein UreF [Tahibacter caeni]|uniref:urease accessory protein UreF n=1 Tax=Tahibacter caeni TaxID=1453545 RepID=UPI002147DE89|nr:urease accessory UreF family protein [Tahibacter caeni]
MAEPALDARMLPALLQLASAALPIGGFGYSGGLEAAVEARLVHDEASTGIWMTAMLEQVWAGGEARHWLSLQQAFAAADAAAFAAANTLALAMRETAELRLESEQTGRSLSLWLLALPATPLDGERRRQLASLRPIAHVAAHAAAATVLGLTPAAGLQALGWSLLENLTLAAVKLVPLGQDAGQRLLRRAAAGLPALIAALPAAAPPQNFAPLLAILSGAHETQYTRLFRS